MSKQIDYERGTNGEYIILVDGEFYCSCDTWAETKEARLEILDQNWLVLV